MDCGYLADRKLQAEIKPWFQIGPVVGLWPVYLLLAVLLTWPTVTHLATHLPGDGADDPAIAWNLWWLKYALLHEGGNPFQTGFMFYPIGLNLAFYTLTVLNAATALPLTLNWGVVAASNLHLFFSLVVAGYGAFLLARYVLVTADHRLPAVSLEPRQLGAASSLNWVSAAIAGGFYAFASSQLFYVALGQFNIASHHWVPFTVLYLLRSQRQPGRLKNPLLAGLFLTLQAWTELTYASFLLVFMGLYWILDFGLPVRRAWILGEQGRAKPSGEIQSPVSPRFAWYLWAIIVMGVIFTIGLSPILVQMWPELQTEGDFLLEGSGFAEDFSADLFGFIIPTRHHPVLGHLVEQSGIEDFTLGQHIYLGLVWLGLLLLGLWLSRGQPALRFWLVAAFIFALLCLGPIITVNGYSTGLAGPFSLLQSLPFFKGNRYPSRYSVLLLLSLSVVAAFGLAHLGRWAGSARREGGPATRSNGWPGRAGLRAYWPLALLSLLFLFEHLSVPLPQSDMRAPAPYQLIAAEPGDFAVLDIPLAWRNGFRVIGPLTTQFMFGQFYQTVHQKRLLQGNTSRNPELKFQYFTRAPVINSLLALETGKTLPPERWAADRVIAAEVLHFFNIKYIVVRPDQTNQPNVTPQATLPYIEDLLPVQKIHDEAAIKLYRVEDSPHEAGAGEGSDLLINTRTPLAPLYFGEGWGLLSPGQAITAQRREVRLLLPLTGQPQQITLRLRLPEVYQVPAQTVFLAINGWQSPAQKVEPGWQELRFDLPAAIAQPGLNDLYLHFSELTTLPPYGAEAPLLDVTVLSAGKEVGDFGHIFINGYELSPNRRGYNLVVLPAGTRPRVANFDTHLDPAASATLADFVTTVPADALIAVAADDEASYNLSEVAVQALQSVGAEDDLRGCFRCSHAFIRAPAGITLEALDALRPVGLTTGLGLTEPQVAAVVEWIRVK